MELKVTLKWARIRPNIFKYDSDTHLCKITADTKVSLKILTNAILNVNLNWDYLVEGRRLTGEQWVVTVVGANRELWEHAERFLSQHFHIKPRRREGEITLCINAVW